MSSDLPSDTDERPSPGSLLPEKLRARIPGLYDTEKVADPIVHAKLFTPWTRWSWFVTEFDGEDCCFGLVSGQEVELGYFSLAELEAIEGPGALRIERDLHFDPQPLSKVRRDLELLRHPPDGFFVQEARRAFGARAAPSSVKTVAGQRPPSPFEAPGIRLVETWLSAASMGPGFGSVSIPLAAAKLFDRLIGEADCEQGAVLFLNSKHAVTHAHLLSRGTLQSSHMHPREVFKAAVLANAAAIVIAHNHPSGDVLPSRNDQACFARLKEVGELLGIPVLDSLIVGPAGKYFAASRGEVLPLPRDKEFLGSGRARAGEEFAGLCRGLLQDVYEVLERQGEGWWDETVTSGALHRSRAEKLLGLEPYAPMTDAAEQCDAPGHAEPG